MRWIRLDGDEGGAGVFRDMSGGGLLGHWSGVSVLSIGSEVPAAERGGAADVYWSGSAAELPEARDDQAIERSGAPALWTADPRTWGRSGWTATERVGAARGERLVLRPHALHVVSDIPGCARALSVLASVRLLIDPASMLPREMLRQSRQDALDHLRRTYEWCGGLSDLTRIFGFVVANVRADQGAPGGVRAVPVTQAGVFEPEEIRDLTRVCLGSAIPRVLIGTNAEQQRDFLEG